LFRDIRLEPVADGRKRRMLEIALQITPDPRLKAQVMRLAVALPEPREDAEDLGIPLRPQNLVMGTEAIAVDDAGSVLITV
jgi:hypothetical protein